MGAAPLGQDKVQVLWEAAHLHWWTQEVFQLEASPPHGRVSWQEVGDIIAVRTQLGDASEGRRRRGGDDGWWSWRGWKVGDERRWDEEHTQGRAEAQQPERTQRGQPWLNLPHNPVPLLSSHTTLSLSSPPSSLQSTAEDRTMATGDRTGQRMCSVTWSQSEGEKYQQHGTQLQITTSRKLMIETQYIAYTHTQFWKMTLENRKTRMLFHTLLHCMVVWKWGRHRLTTMISVMPN